MDEFHKIINNGLSLIPHGINTIFISRADPPPVFARLQASEKINCVGWDEIKFTIDEFRGAITQKGIKNITPEITAQLHSKTDGWIAGLILLLENAKTKNIDYGILDKLTHQEIFNYFINEVFEKIDKDVQSFLLKTAFLPKFTVEIAKKLTNNKNAEKIVSFLYTNQYFIIKQFQESEPVYWYHALFNEFLLFRALRTFTKEDIFELKKNAALLLEIEDIHSG